MKPEPVDLFGMTWIDIRTPPANGQHVLRKFELADGTLSEPGLTYCHPAYELAGIYKRTVKWFPVPN
jgi:hypothetical protein